MNKDSFYIGIAIVAAILVTAFFATFVASERHRSENVVALRNRVAEIKTRYRKNRPASFSAHEEETPEPHAQEEESAPVRAEDGIAILEQIIQSMSGASGDALQPFLKQWGELSEDEKEDIEAFLEGNQELILEIRRLAETGGPFHDLDLSRGFQIELPHLAKLRNFALLLAANMRSAAARGDYENVTKDAVAIMRLADAVGREPILISQLVRVAMYHRLYGCIEQHLPGEDMPPELFAQMVHHTSGNRSRDRLADALAMEASWGVTEAFDSVRMGTDPRSNTFVMRLYRGIGRPLLNRDEEIYAGIMERVGDAMRLPYYQAQPELEQIRVEVENTPHIRLISRPMLNILFPSHAAHPEAVARNEAQLGLMRVGLAIERHHAQHGAYPVALETVAPALGGALPLDPYTGQPFVYEPGADGFLLYSARGSVVAHDPARPIPGTNAQGNVVWRGTGE